MVLVLDNDIFGFYSHKLVDYCTKFYRIFLLTYYIKHVLIILIKP